MKHLAGVVWFAVVAVGVLNAAEAAGPSGHAWTTYANERFGYSICYPSDLLTPEPESDNGDGRSFTSNQGAKLTVFASNWDGTLADSLKLDLGRFSGTVTYKVVRLDWYVLSGHNADKIFYAKTVRLNGQFRSFDITYPDILSSAWNPLAAQISACFKGLLKLDPSG